MLEVYAADKSAKLLEARIYASPADALESIRSLAASEPLSRQSQLLLAQCYSNIGDHANARRTLQQLLDANPDHDQAKTSLARACSADGDTDEAIRLLTEVTATSPEFEENWVLLAELLDKGGDTEGSRNALKQHEMISDFNRQLREAERAFETSNFKLADEICRRLILIVPNEVRTYRLLAKIARQFGHHDFSTTTLSRYVAVRTNDIPLRLEFAQSLLGSRAFKQALEQCDVVIEQAPGLIDAYELKSEILFQLDRFDESVAILRALAELPEKAATCLPLLGKALKTVGDVDGARKCYREAIKVDPTGGRPYWELADLKTERLTEQDTASMMRLLEKDDLPAIDRVMIGFAMGKALEDAERFDESFEYYESANSLFSNMRPANYSNQNARFTSTFTEEFFAERRCWGEESTAPIFVVGLPRSGTTLLEQILSSHSKVDATQELDEIVSIARAVGQRQPGTAYPEALRIVDQSQVSELARRYLDFAAQFRDEAPHFVDKAPHNFQHIGLIKTLLPNAKVIDIRRHPMAGGWSLYRQFFADSYLMSNQLHTIGHYYCDYVELMAHWQAALEGDVLTVKYEDLVGDLPGVVSEILEFCGLEFEAACIDFHLNRRAVATPSSEQVRQPIYTSSLEHWKNYKKHLAPLRQVLLERGHLPDE